MKIETVQQLETYSKRFGLTGFSEKELMGFLTKFKFESNQVIDDVLYELSIRNENFKFVPEKEIPKPRSVRQVSEERIYEKAIERQAPSTGWSELDRLIKGFIPNHLYLFTGDTNVGKTSCACVFANNVASQGKNVLYFALEPENTVVDYIASARTGKIFDDLTEDDILADDGHIEVYGKENVRKIEDLVKIIESSSKHYDLIIIDHIGYFIGGRDVYTQQSDVVKILAGLTKKNKVAILMIAHLRKRPSNKKAGYIPTSDDVSGSASFKQDSTDVMILTKTLEDEESDNPKYSNHGVLYVTKTKSGPNGTVDVYFHERSAKIETLGQKTGQESQKEYYKKRNKIYNPDSWIDDISEDTEQKDLV